jgi:hypothetical protein
MVDVGLFLVPGSWERPSSSTKIKLTKILREAFFEDGKARNRSLGLGPKKWSALL